jgi:hypothetical protein
VRESADDLRSVVEAEQDPVERLRAFTIRLHEWCDPGEAPRKRGSHNRLAISEFSVQLAATHPDRVKAALAPVSRMLLELVEGAAATKAITVKDARRTAALIQQTVMYSWFGNRLIPNARSRVTAEETWQFCLHGISG